MSVRILEPRGPDASVVTSKQAFADRDGTNGETILIGNFDETQLLEDSLDSNVTYDLRVGEEFRLLFQGEKRRLAEGDWFDLKGGESALIQTEEFVNLPATFFGLVVAKVSLAQQGMSNISTKIDPGYDGPLIVTVSNLSHRPIRFKRKDAFCSVLFLRVDGKAALYEKGAKTIGTRTQVRPLKRLIEMIEAHPSVIAVAAVFTSIALAVLQNTVWD